MATYKLVATLVQEMEIAIEAKSRSEALEKARKSDINDWDLMADLDFVIDDSPSLCKGKSIAHCSGKKPSAYEQSEANIAEISNEPMKVKK